MPARTAYPTWEVNEEFKEDVFTFVRVRYDSYGPYGWWDRWDNDYPDSDWNFSLGRCTWNCTATNRKRCAVTC